MIGSLLAFAQGFTDVTGNIPSMNVARYGHAAVNLPNNKVLVIGGHTSGFYLTSTAEIYDPALNTWTLYNVPNPHDMIGWAELNNGNFIFMGGCSSGYGVGQSTVTTIYSPTANTFTNGPAMLTARTNSNAAKLANGNVLVVGNWYNTGDAELYDATANQFVTVGTPVTARSLALILPCTDGSAYVLGGYGIYGSPTFTDVEMYLPSTNQFTAVSSQIFSGETDWHVAWSTVYRNIADLKMANGNYVFMTYKTVSGVTSYRIGQFNPTTKVFSFLTTTPPIPDYDGTSAAPYAFWANIMLDPTNNYIYINAYNTYSGNYEDRIYTLDATTGILSIPTGETDYSYMVASGTKAWLNGNIMYTGGTTDGSNFNVTADVKVLSPTNSFGVKEEKVAAVGLLVYPNPVAEKFTIKLPNTGSYEAVLFNEMGHAVQRSTIIMGDEQITIERENLPAGFYVLEVKHEFGISRTRIILQ